MLRLRIEPQRWQIMKGSHGSRRRLVVPVHLSLLVDHLSGRHHHVVVVFILVAAEVRAAAQWRHHRRKLGVVPARPRRWRVAACNDVMKCHSKLVKDENDEISQVWVPLGGGLFLFSFLSHSINCASIKGSIMDQLSNPKRNALAVQL